MRPLWHLSGISGTFHPYHRAGTLQVYQSLWISVEMM